LKLKPVYYVLGIIVLFVLFIGGSYLATPQGRDYNESIEIQAMENSTNIANISLALNTDPCFDMIYHIGNKTYAGDTLNNGSCIPIDYRHKDYTTIERWLNSSSSNNNDGYFYKEVFQKDKLYILAGLVVGDKVYYYSGYRGFDKVGNEILYDSYYQQKGNEVMIKRHLNWINYTVAFMWTIFILTFGLLLFKAETKRR